MKRICLPQITENLNVAVNFYSLRGNACYLLQTVKIKSEKCEGKTLI